MILPSNIFDPSCVARTHTLVSLAMDITNPGHRSCLREVTSAS